MKLPIPLLTRWSHHLLHRMPYRLGDPPRGEWVVVGADVGAAMEGCGGLLLKSGLGRTVAFLGEEPDPSAASAFGFDAIGAEGFANRLEAEAVSVLFVPFLGSQDPAEREMLDRVVAALEKTRGWQGELWMYENAVPLWPNRGVDISANAREKSDLLDGLGGRTTVADGLARYRGLRPVVAHAEAFLALTRGAFLREARRWSR